MCVTLSDRDLSHLSIHTQGGMGGAHPGEVEEQLDTLLASSARFWRLDSLHYAPIGCWTPCYSSDGWIIVR